MERRALGKSGLEVSVVGFGCGGTSGVMGRGSLEQRRAVAARALDAGVSWFDTSPSYDGTQSESGLGETLQELGVRPVVATKVPLRDGDLEDIPVAVERSVDASLKRLRLDAVDLIQLHNKLSSRRRAEFPNELTPDDLLKPGGVADAFEALARKGKVRAWGFTGVGHRDAVETVVRSGRFHTVQLVYNLLNPSAGLELPAGFRGADYSGLIDLAADQGMGVICIRVLAAGALTGASRPHPLAGGWSVNASHEVEGDKARAKSLEFLVEDGRTMAQAALHFAVARPGVSTALIGFSDVEHVEQLATVPYPAGWPSEEELRRIRGLRHPD